jgi:hypothetical protein
MAAWLQASACSPAASAAMRDAELQLGRLDTSGALKMLDEAAVQGCRDADISAVFLRALAVARGAYAAGGSPESLEPVESAAATLERQARSGSRVAELGWAMLMAAAAAAQSERGDMTVWLEQAASTEPSVPAAPARVINLAVVTGDLWLQVHRYDLAGAAYRRAAAAGKTIASTLGLARVARRLGDRPGACEAYRELLGLAPDDPDATPAVAEARTFVTGSTCSSR